MTFRDKVIPVHRDIPNKPGRKVAELIPIFFKTSKHGTYKSVLMYYCVPCDRKFNKAQAFSACPYCSNPLLAKVKE